MTPATKPIPVEQTGAPAADPAPREDRPAVVPDGLVAEAALAFLRRTPREAPRLFLGALGGKAHLSRMLGERTSIDQIMLAPEGEGGRMAGWRAVTKAMRLHQWSKNALVAVPLVLGGRAFDPQGWLTVIAGMLLLGLLASSTYVLNDLWDLEDDRRHWTKRRRPFASGRLSIASGLIAAPIGVVLALAGAFALGPAVFAGFIVYLGLTLTYSLWVKRIMVLDAFTLASLFTMRLVIGIALAQVPGSPWLLVFSMFLFASLSLAKRHTEILRVIESGRDRASGRGYLASDGPVLIALGAASGVSAVLVMVLYLIDEAFRAGYYSTPTALWAFPCALFIFLGRIWVFSGRGELNDDPVVFAIKDRASLCLGAGMAVAFVAAVWPARFLPW